MDVDFIRRFLAENGAALGVMEIVEVEDGQEWTIVVDPDLIVFLQVDAARHVLVLSATVGKPDDADRAVLNDFMLRYNFVWKETGGLRLALDGEGGSIVLLRDLHVDGTPEQLRTALLSYIAASRGWQAIASGDADGHSDGGPPQDAVLIRV